MSPTNWPNPERHGYPMFPERDGWHAVSFNSAFWGFWVSKYQRWVFNGEEAYYRPDDADPGFSYIGPVLHLTQIAEMLAAERERAAQEAIRIGESWNGTELSPTNAARTIAHAIRNLGDAI